MPVRRRRFRASACSPVTEAAALWSATCTSASAGTGTSGGHELVEDPVAAEIGVRQHVVADRLRLPQPPQWPTISQQSGRSTARWSVIVFAFEGPTPILTSVVPCWVPSASRATKW